MIFELHCTTNRKCNNVQSSSNVSCRSLQCFPREGIRAKGNKAAALEARVGDESDGKQPI